MASKVYTAQEFREFAAIISRLHIVDRTTCGEYCASIKDKIRSMLRQSADSLEREERREKKYEYTHKYGDDVISVNHTDDVRKCFVPMGAVMVRRQVGEWEEVKDGK